MRKRVFGIFITVLVILFISGCKTPESTGAGPTKIEEKQKDDEKGPETYVPDNSAGINYKWTDVSNTEFNFSGINDFFYSNKTIFALKNSGTETSGNKLRNFLLSSLGRQDVTGFEAQVKIGSNMTSCGFEFSGHPSYSSYWFMIKEDGTFVIKLQDYRSGSVITTTLLLSSPGNYDIKTDDFNTVKMVSLPNGKDAEVYVNGNLVYTIRDLIFTKGTFAIYYQVKKGNYSNSRTAAAEYKVKAIQKITP